VSASGGTPVEVTKLRDDIGERIHVTPFFLPDGRHFLYLAIRHGIGLRVRRHSRLSRFTDSVMARTRRRR